MVEINGNKLTSRRNQRTKAEKILEDIESQLRKLITDKRELKKKFLAKLKEIERQNKDNQEWYKTNWKEAERIENKLMLLWDFWQREVEIKKLRDLKEEVMPSERKELIEREEKLNAYNVTLEQGFKDRKIDVEVVKEIKKRLGIWEEKED